MTPGYSRVLIADLILPNTDCNPRAVGLDIGMMVLHSGLQRNEKEWEELLAAAGLQVVRFWIPPADGDGVIEAVRK